MKINLSNKIQNKTHKMFRNSKLSEFVTFLNKFRSIYLFFEVNFKASANILHNFTWRSRIASSST